MFSYHSSYIGRNHIKSQIYIRFCAKIKIKEEGEKLKQYLNKKKLMKRDERGGREIKSHLGTLKIPLKTPSIYLSVYCWLYYF